LLIALFHPKNARSIFYNKGGKSKEIHPASPNVLCIQCNASILFWRKIAKTTESIANLNNNAPEMYANARGKVLSTPSSWVEFPSAAASVGEPRSTPRQSSLRAAVLHLPLGPVLPTSRALQPHSWNMIQSFGWENSQHVNLSGEK
jgi:hypothetical protein